jgi:hypothetical protein
MDLARSPVPIDVRQVRINAAATGSQPQPVAVMPEIGPAGQNPAATTGRRHDVIVELRGTVALATPPDEKVLGIEPEAPAEAAPPAEAPEPEEPAAPAEPADGAEPVEPAPPAEAVPADVPPEPAAEPTPPANAPPPAEAAPQPEAPAPAVQEPAA